MDLYGIKHVYLCKLGKLKKGDLPADSVTAFGLNKSHNLVIKDDDQVKTYKEQMLSNRINFKLEAESLQTDIAAIYNVFSGYYLPDGGCDAQIVTNNGLVFDFTRDNNTNLGFDAEFVLSEKERFIKYTLEASFDYRVGKEIISAAAVNSVVNVTPTNMWTYRRPDFKYVNIGTYNPERMEWVSRKLTLKTIGNKNERKQSLPRYAEAKLELVINRADYLRLAYMFSQNELITVTFEDYDAIVNNQQRIIRFVFNGLGIARDISTMQDKNEVKVTLVNRYPYNQISYGEQGVNYVFSFND